MPSNLETALSEHCMSRENYISMVCYSETAVQAQRNLCAFLDSWKVTRHGI